MRKAKLTLQLVGLLAALVAGLGALETPAAFFPSYLFAFVFWSAVSIGAFGTLLMAGLTGGRWIEGLRPSLQALSKNFPLLALLFLPVIAGVYYLYPWTEPGQGNFYLNVPFFIARNIIYFASWVAACFFVSGASAATLVWLFITVTFASVDWVMSLEHGWYSTVFGLIFIVGGGLQALSLAVMLSLRDTTPTRDRQDWGNLLLAFIMTFAYLSFMQFLIMWSGNLPDEVIWYKHRIENGWGFLGACLIVFAFAVPFFLLLFRRLKASRSALMSLAALTLLLQVVHAFWFVVPSFRWRQLNVTVVDVACFVAVGAFYLGMALGRLEGPVPVYIPVAKESEVLGHG